MSPVTRSSGRKTTRKANRKTAPKPAAAKGRKSAGKSSHVVLPRPKLGPVNEWFELRRSPIQGVGAFAIQDIPKGTKLIEYAGEKISNAEADRRYDDDTMGRHHTFLFILTQRTCVDAAVGGNESMYINHSCDPNCETEVDRGKIWIRSIKAIPAGTELSYDYQYVEEKGYTEKDLRFYACHCGSAKCRGTIVKTRKRLK
jgi:uncharacterized protein